MISQPLKKGLVCGIIALFFSLNVVPIQGSLFTENHRDYTSENIDHSVKNSGILTNHGSLSGHVTDAGMNPLQGVRVRVSFYDTYRENDIFGKCQR